MKTNHFTPTHTFHKDGKISLNVESVMRTIVEAIGLFFLQKGHLLIIKEQQLILAGCFSGTSASCAWLIRSDKLPEGSLYTIQMLKKQTIGYGAMQLNQRQPIF